MNNLFENNNDHQSNYYQGYKTFSDALDVDYCDKLARISLYPSKYDALPIEFLISKLTENPFINLVKLLEDYSEFRKTHKNEHLRPQSGGKYFSILGTEIEICSLLSGCKNFPLAVELYVGENLLPGRTILVSGYYGRGIRLIHFYPITEEYKNLKPFAAFYGHFANVTDKNYNYLKIRNSKFTTQFKHVIAEPDPSEGCKLIIQLNDSVSIEDIIKEDNEINEYLKGISSRDTPTSSSTFGLSSSIALDLDKI